MISYLAHCSLVSRLIQESTNVVIKRMPHPLTGIFPSYLYLKVKVNITIELATKVQRSSRGIALLFL